MSKRIKTCCEQCASLHASAGCLEGDCDNAAARCGQGSSLVASCKPMLQAIHAHLSIARQRAARGGALVGSVGGVCLSAKQLSGTSWPRCSPAKIKRDLYTKGMRRIASKLCRDFRGPRQKAGWTRRASENATRRDDSGAEGKQVLLRCQAGVAWTLNLHLIIIYGLRLNLSPHTNPI
jgi:hypothetical protein